MNKSTKKVAKAATLAATIGAAVFTYGCRSTTRPECVYGPPTCNQNEPPRTVVDTPPECVYGPPSWFEDSIASPEEMEKPDSLDVEP